MSNLRDDVFDMLRLNELSKNDLAITYELEEIYNNADEIEKFVENYDIPESFSLDDLINFFVLKKVVYLSSIDFVCDDERRKTINKIFEVCSCKFHEMEKLKKQRIDFYNLHMQDIIENDKSKNNYKPMLLEHCCLDIKSFMKQILENTFSIILECNPYYFLKDVEFVVKLLQYYPNLEATLYDGEILEAFFDPCMKEYAELITKKSNKKFLFGELRQSVIAYVANRIEEIVKTVTNDQDNQHLISLSIAVEKYVSFLSKVQSEKYNDYSSYLGPVKEIESNWIKKYGQTFSFEIPADKIIEQIDKEQSWEIKLLGLTHTYNKSNKKLEHQISYILRTPNALTDLFETSTKHNSNFTPTRIRSLDMLFIVMRIAIGRYSGKDNKSYKLFVNSLASFLGEIATKIGYDTSEAENDMNFWSFNYYGYIFCSDNKHYRSLISLDCSIKFIEKILRKVFIYERKKRREFFDESFITLGQILEDDYVGDVLTQDVIKFLNYYLLKDIDDKRDSVGLNLRNKVMHNYDICITTFDENYGYLGAWLLTSVINSLFIYYHG